MGLRAVVFDYGMVLSGPQHPESHEMLKRITGLPHDEFERYYWADRHDYDRGALSGITFWQKVAKEAGLTLTDVEIAELNDHDARMWTTANPEMIAWHKALKERGLKTAILSNMGDSVLENIERSFDWIKEFDVLVWSYQLLLAKPEPEIYEYVLEKLETAPEETLFLDDKMVNIEAAHKLGIQALQFSTVEQLRQDLISTGLDEELPLP